MNYRLAGPHGVRNQPASKFKPGRSAATPSFSLMFSVSYFGEPGGTRTHGPKIKSLVLYHMSYGLAQRLRTPSAVAGQYGPSALHVGRNPHVHNSIRTLHSAAGTATALDLVDEIHA